MSQVSAIVFDSNVFGKALPKISTIERWAQACAENDAVLWIPRVVALELAQHVIESVEAMRSAVEKHNRDRVTWGLPRAVVPQPVAVQDVLDALEEAGAELVPLEGEDAREAIADQILMRGAGERKDGVKTGAADSAWLRSVFTANGGDGDGLIIVTADSKALLATCGELGVEVPRHAKHLGELHGNLDETALASAEYGEMFRAWLDARFELTGGVSGDIDGLVELSGETWWDNELDRSFRLAWHEQGVHVEGARPSEVVGDLNFDGWSNSLAATVAVHLSVVEQYSRPNRFGDEPEFVDVKYPGEMRVAVTLFLDDRNEVDGYSLDDVELIHPASEDIERVYL